MSPAGAAGPYVLVGHSLGGMLVRLYASAHPDEVAGLVLVDALSEGFRAHMPPAQWRAFERFALQAAPPLDRYPDIEKVAFDAAVTELVRVAAVRPLRPMPVVVLSKSRPFGFPANLPGLSVATLERAWREAQQALPSLMPCAAHVTARTSHYIQLEQPRLVIEAIQRVADAQRTGSRCPLPTGPSGRHAGRLPATP